jgi:predicted dehydrogenase
VTQEQEQIRVGIVGADTKASWAKVSHVPAIRGLPGVRLAAMATRSERSAREAAEAFGADRWFSDPFAMIRDDRIDVVTIAVKVPAHRELVLTALEAGKAVYCEAPLGCSVAETQEMVRAARSQHGDRVAGTAESGRATRGGAGFLGKDRASAQRPNCISNLWIRSGNARCARYL